MCNNTCGENKEGNSCGGCECKQYGMGSMCGKKMHGHFNLIKMILVIFILTFVFCVGEKIGEMKGSFENGYSGSHHRRSMMSDYSGYGQGGGWQIAPISELPAPASTSTTK